MRQHAWRLTHQDYSAARWVCLNCGVIKTSVRQFDHWPSVKYRMPDGYVLNGTAPECGKAATDGGLPADG